MKVVNDPIILKAVFYYFTRAVSGMPDTALVLFAGDAPVLPNSRCFLLFRF